MRRGRGERTCVNHHTGGLEITGTRLSVTGRVNHHTGGLENWTR